MKFVYFENYVVLCIKAKMNDFMARCEAAIDNTRRRRSARVESMTYKLVLFGPFSVKKIISDFRLKPNTCLLQFTYRPI